VPKILCGLIAVAALAGATLAQPLAADKVPANVRDAFRSKFPGVSQVEWKRKSDKNYEAEFTLKGVEVAAKFDAEGKWLETETAIEPSALTKEVRATLAKDYKDYKIIETQKVERAHDKSTLFEVHLENADEILKVQLEANGTVASKSAKRKTKEG
jgi:hypothetical protein